MVQKGHISTCHLVEKSLFWQQSDIWLQVQLTKVRLCVEPHKVVHAYRLLTLIVPIKLHICCYGDVCEVMISNSPHDWSCRSWSVCYTTVSQWCRAAPTITVDCWYPERTGGIHTFWWELTWKSGTGCLGFSVRVCAFIPSEKWILPFAIVLYTYWGFLRVRLCSPGSFCCFYSPGSLI